MPSDSELQDLTADIAPAAGDVVYVVIDPAGTPLARKMTVENLLKAVHLLSELTTADAETDKILVGNILEGTWAKYITPANLMKAWFLDSEGDPANTSSTTASDGTSTYASRRDHVHISAAGKTRLSLPPSAGYPPDDSSGSAAAQLQMKITGDVTDPQVRWPELLFDATTEEHWYWSFAMPSNYGSAPIIDVYYKATSATTGTAAFNAKIMAITPDDAADMDVDEFAAEQTAGSEAVPGTAGIMSTISVTLSNADSVAANDLVVLAVFRDVSEDGVTGDLEVPMVVLRYTGA